jgi:4-hydroxybenzoate polyprenyltransferase
VVRRTVAQLPWREYARLIRLDRPVGIWLVLWPTLWALWFAADGIPPLSILLIFTAGVVVMRSAGCAINDYADRNFDGHVARTASRPLATGAVTPHEALVIFALLILIALLLVIQLNLLTILLSIPALLLAASYPFSKRFTSLPQAWLGIAFGWAVPMAFAATTGSVTAAAWWIFVATVSWAIAYDTLYAMVDRDDDRKIGVKSSALLFGRYARPMVALFQLITLAALYLAGTAFAVGMLFNLGLAIAALLFIWHQILIRDEDRHACFNAFLQNHWAGLVIFVALALDRYLAATAVG